MTDQPINAVATDTDGADGVPVPVTIEGDTSDYDPRSAAVLRVLYGTVLVLELIKDAIEEGDPDEEIPVTQEMIDAFKAAHEAGELARDHPDWDAFLTDATAMDDAVLHELATTLPPVAPVFGATIDLPVDVDDGANRDAVDNVAETIATLRGRRSS